MPSKTVTTIRQRLSLRAPQQRSLEILDRIAEIVRFEKNADIAEQLSVIHSEFSKVTDFERSFLSLCFALATGVGKTRLMGAFITYLFKACGIRSFLVIAPNLTIYNKLLADFTPGTSKYVFTGIDCFATNPPLIVTGDDYESGRGVRGSDLFNSDQVHINIFNIAKLTAKDKGHLAEDDSAKSIARIRRLSEYIGESYFNYLSGLNDLVILMDESHRYRADAGMAAINELNPVLGLELTATPQIVRGNNTVAFQNVIYGYSLSEAMDDGFVKEPAVATRAGFDMENFKNSPEALERMKLNDGANIHEVTKVELETYAANHQVKKVKPFILVVAESKAHADELEAYLTSDEFRNGAYKGKVTKVYSGTKASERDQMVADLLEIEKPENPTEIVIHVNMLGEGWDVTNLYTIIPLRAANSVNLVEQSIGRGLRLPYGKRTGVDAVDRLTVVSHDKYSAIIDHAKDPNSLIRRGVVIGSAELPEAGKKRQIVIPKINQTFHDIKPNAGFSCEEAKAAPAVFEAIKQIARQKKLDLSRPEIRKEVAARIQEEMGNSTLPLEFPDEQPIDLVRLVNKVSDIVEQFTIDIPKITVIPCGVVRSSYRNFDLDCSNIHLQPIADEIKIQHLHDGRDAYLLQSDAEAMKKQPEDYIIAELMMLEEVDYDDNAEFLYRLASQLVVHLRSYLASDEEVANVVLNNRKQLADIIQSQLRSRLVTTTPKFDVLVTPGFYELKENEVTIDREEEPRDFRQSIPGGDRSRIRNMIFTGFRKSLYPYQKFDSEPERLFAEILESSPTVLKWFKPAQSNFKLAWRDGDYSPDFIVETTTEKLMCEPKNPDDLKDEDVLLKADTAALWCNRASSAGGKPWRYLLIPADKINQAMTLDSAISKFQLVVKQV